MKLHLPKQLFTALLAAITFAAPAALTIGSVSSAITLSGNTAITVNGATYDATIVSGADNQNMNMGANITLAAGSEIIAFSLHNNQTGTTSGSNWFSDTQKYAGDILIYDDSLEDEVEKGLVINNGGVDDVITFAGKVYGNGVIHKTSGAPSNGMTFKFTGDMSAFTGDIILDGNSKDKLIITGSTTGTGSINSNGAITFNGATVYSAEVTTTDALNIGVEGEHSITTIGRLADPENDLSAVAPKVNVGTATISSGASLNILNGSLTSTGSFTNNGTLTVNSGASLVSNGIFANAAGATITVDGSFTNSGTLVLNSTMQGTGTVTNSGNGVIKLGDYTLNNFSNVTYVGGTTSGFVNTLTVFANSSAYSGSVNVGDTAYDVTDGNVTLGGADKTYYVNEDLTYDADTMGGATTIAIAQNATLTAPTSSVSDHSLVGSGVYKLAAGATAFTQGMTFGEAWTGTVLLGTTTSDNFDFDHFGTAASIVEIGEGCTISTYLANANVQYDTNIKLTGDLAITDGWSTKTYTFAGKILGAGSITKSGSHSTNYKFLNDVSGWEGSLKCTKGTLNAVFGGKASVINADINANGGTISLEVATESAASFNKSVGVSSLTLNQSATFKNALTVANAATIASGKVMTVDGSYTASIAGTLTNNGTLEVINGATLSISSAITNAGSLTIASGAKLQINSLSGYNCTKGDYTLNGTDGTYGYQEGLIWTYNLVTGAGRFTLNGSIMLGETDITSSVTNGQYIVAQNEKVYEITGAYTGPVIEYNGSSGETAAADSFIVHEGASLKITDTLNTNGTLGKNISGAGTLIIAAAANDSVAFTSSYLAEFTGTVDVTSGQLYVGLYNNEDSPGAAVTMGTEKIIVREGAELWVHLGERDRAISPDIDLVSGSSLKNRDGHATLNGNIRFNIIDPEAETPSYDANGEVTLSMHWDNNNVLNGLLSGDGIVNLKAPSKGGTGSWKLTNNNNTFAGSYNLMDGGNGGMKLILSAQNAAQYATINLNGSSSVSTLELATSATIKALNSTDADNVVTTTANATLTVSEGSFGGKLQNGSSSTLSLTKTGSGTLTLSGSVGAENSRLGTVSVTAGELKLTGTGYVTTLAISGDADVRVDAGGNLNVTTFNASTTNANANRNVYIEKGATVTASNFNVNWNMGTVKVDGLLNATTELYLGTGNDDNTAKLLSGAGEISATKLRAGNYGSYGVNVATLSIGASGLVVENEAVLNLASTTTTVSGITTVNSGNELNFVAGSATLFGGISAVGTVGLSGGSLILDSGENISNTIAQFNYSGGTLSHSGLTVTNATFSGTTLDNAGNGTLTLTGTLNITNIGGLTKAEGGSYTGGTIEGNGFYTGNLTVITGGNLDYGENFAVQLNGSALTTNSENASYYTQSANSLTLNVTDTSTFIVNIGTESLAYSTAATYYVAENAVLELTGLEEFSDPLVKTVTGTGTVKVAFDGSDHDESVQFGDAFNGVLEVSGNVQLGRFNLGNAATIKLISGEVWSNNVATIAQNVLIGGTAETPYTFIGGSALTFDGAVTSTDNGGYVKINDTLPLTFNNAGTNLTQITVANGTANLNAGTYGTVKSTGGNTNISGGSVTTATISGGTVNVSAGSVGTMNVTDGIANVSAGSVGTMNVTDGIANVTGGSLATLITSGGSASVTGGTVSSVYSSGGTTNLGTSATGGLVVSGGTVNITGTASVGTDSGSMKVRDDGATKSTGIYGHTGTINIGDGTTATTVTTNRVEMGDSGSDTGGALNVKANATLVVTSSSGGKTLVVGDYGSAGFLLGEWGTSSTMNVAGTVLAKDTAVLNGDKKAIINIEDGGVLATKGLGRDVGDGVELVLADNGKLILGSEGISASSTCTATLQAGTIGIYADEVSISKDLTLSSTTGTTFDTQKYTWTGNNAISRSEDAGNGGALTISGALSGSGKLIKNGAGELILSGANTYSGSTEITGGTLTVSNTSALGTGSVSVTSGQLNIAENINLALSDTLSAAAGTVVLSSGAGLTLAGGTAEAQKEHSIGTLTTAAEAGISLGDYATLELVSTQPGRFAGDNTGNSDSVSSLELAISGGTGSVLKLHMTTNTGWEYNNTVSLSTLTGATGGVETVCIGSGSLANAVYDSQGTATTNLNGAALRMADGTSIVLRKANSSENLGAGDITLEGTTQLYNYGINSTLTNNISGGSLNVTNAGTVTLAGNVNLQALQMGIDTILGDGEAERTYSLGAIDNTASKTITISRNATLKNVSSVTGTVKLAGSGVLDLGNAAYTYDSANTGNQSINQSTPFDFSDSWSGTVRIQDAIHADNKLGLNLHNISNANSAVELINVAGWFAGTMAGSLILTADDANNAAWKIVNGSSSSSATQNMATFNGAVSGDGKITYAWSISGTINNSTVSAYTGITFGGDVSGWRGAFEMDVESNYTNFTLTFNGAASNVFAAIGSTESNTAKLHLKVDTAAAATFRNTVSASTVTLNQSATFMQGMTTSGAVSVASGKSLTLQGTTSIGGLLAGEGASIIVSANGAVLNFNGAGEHKITNIDPKSYSNIAYNVAGGAVLNVLSNMWMKNSSINLAEGAVFKKFGNLEVIGTGHSTSISRAEAGGSALTTDNSAFTIENAQVKMTNSSGMTLGMKLANSSLTSSGAGMVTVSNSGNTITNLAVEGGPVKLSESMSIQSLAAKSEKVVTVTSGKTISMGNGAVSIGTNGADATLTAKSDNAIAQLAEGASFTIQDMTLTNTTITAATAGTEVKLQNVTAENTMLAGGHFELKATPEVGTYNPETATGTLSYSNGLGVQTGASLTLNLDVISAVSPEQHGVYDITITLSGFGSEFTIDSPEAIRGMVDFDPGSWLGQALVNQKAEYMVVSEQPPASSGEGGAPTVSYAAGTGGNVGTLTITITGLNVPEPASATLGLAALMMLCARRRRKA